MRQETAGDGRPRPAAAEPSPRATSPRDRPVGSLPLVLLADADEGVHRPLAEQLGAYRITVVHCTDGATALLETGALRPDLLLVSAGLPVLDGVSVLRAVRQRMTLPVVLGFSPREAGLVQPALAAGATACLPRPYRPRDVTRLLSLVGRTARTRRQPVVCGALALDPDSYEVTLRGSRLPQLTVREFRLLELLMRHPGTVVSRERISREVWGARPPRPNTISVHIARLRERLADDPHRPQIIQTVRGVGYRLLPPGP
ncbi:response regulator transcription factor [Streptomyces sp. JJ36]|uniref:response regulator transcription factor n=1 Tax=Streptomyces sp. JJ36 TaxID=2736645 RepID=UPI001F385AD2|nr:response regulator transcription factor [Streptomyces sp. JJ36]MCF6521832.1 response regulator transcription factor [Streptomyces sp. JJ36]